jgi:putative transposase
LTDNDSEFTRNALNAWSYNHHVEHIFTDPGHPTPNGYNGYIESLNGKLRKEIIEDW